MCIRSIMVTLGVEFDCFWLSKPRQKQSKSTPRVTMQLRIDKDGGILYISHHKSWDKAMREQGRDNKYVSHPPEKSTYFYKYQTNSKENLCSLILKIHPWVTMQLYIDHEGGILYILSSIVKCIILKYLNFDQQSSCKSSTFSPVTNLIRCNERLVRTTCYY